MEARLVDALREERVDWRFKGFPRVSGPPPRVRELANRAWNVLAGDLLLPLLVLKQSRLDHNLRVMADYCHRQGVDLAPHAKTSMAPQLLLKHLQAGAWGFTVATTSQARTLRAFGAKRLLLASQLVEARAIEWVSAEVDADEELEMLSLVDSVEAVGILERVLESRGAVRPLRVLVELGQVGGRSGCRSLEEAVAVVKAVDTAAHLELAGVEGFEGLIHEATPEATLAAVDRFLAELRQLTVGLAELGAFDDVARVILTAGGSAFFDRVVAHLTGLELAMPVQTILRSGGYATHDSQMYEEVSPLAARGGGTIDRLQPAFETWAAVWSRPEPELAIVGMGKRDAAYDYGLPIPTTVCDTTRTQRSVRGAFQITDLNDQHAYVRVPADDPVAPGDLLACGISHPCAAFDKWRLIPVVDDDYTVVDGMFTFF